MQKNNEAADGLIKVYQAMLSHFGPRGWWPGETVLEICVGAILTQSVSWKNVVKAIANLKAEGLLDLLEINNSPLERIEQSIVPTLYFRMKAKKLKRFATHIINNYKGDITRMFDKSVTELREELLSIYGIGPETADSIILYAAGKPIFVVDAYTRRIFSRLGFFSENITYDQMQTFFMNHIEPNVAFYNEFHAQIVGVGNSFCGSKRPKCTICPLGEICKYELS